MKDFSQTELTSSRPNVTVKEAVSFCLDRLFADKTHSITDTLTNCHDGSDLTYEELIGALLLSLDHETAQKGELVKMPFYDVKGSYGELPPSQCMGEVCVFHMCKGLVHTPLSPPSDVKPQNTNSPQNAAKEGPDHV